jgi:hypothetical protein
MAQTTYERKIYCITEAKFVSKISYDNAVITVCPNNSSHEVNALSEVDVCTNEIESMYIKTEQPGQSTQGNYDTNTYAFTISANSTVTNDISWDYDISALSYQFYCQPNETGNSVVMWGIVNSPIGYITASVAANATVIHVSSTVQTYINIGYYAILTDGTNTDELGRVIAKDSNAGTITVATPATHSFSPATPTYVKMKVRRTNLELTAGQTFTVGTDHIGGAFIPKGIIMRVVYTNVNNTEVRFRPTVNHMY